MLSEADRADWVRRETELRTAVERSVQEEYECQEAVNRLQTATDRLAAARTGDRLSVANRLDEMRADNAGLAAELRAREEAEHEWRTQACG